MTTSSDSALNAIERFIVENDDLLALEQRIGRFNIFDALSIARKEIQHSNFLAWLLDPAESHGLGQLFLKAVLMDMMRVASPLLRPLSPIDLDGIVLQGIEIRREWSHIDILIVSKQPQFAVAIENKVDAGEGVGQLERYRNSVDRDFPRWPRMFVFLTPSSRDASDEAWVSYSYRDIHRVLNRVRETNEGSIGKEVSVFLDHYLNLIGARFMDDKKIDELCARIYKNHRQALDLLFERINPTSEVLKVVQGVIERQSQYWRVLRRRSNDLDFVPSSWKPWLPAWGTDPEAPNDWLILRFKTEKKDEKSLLRFLVQVEEMRDVRKRKQIVEVLLRQGKDLGFQVPQKKEITDRYTRVSSKVTVFEWDDGEEFDSAELSKRITNKLEKLMAELSGIREILQPLIDE